MRASGNFTSTSSNNKSDENKSFFDKKIRLEITEVRITSSQKIWSLSNYIKSEQLVLKYDINLLIFPCIIQIIPWAIWSGLQCLRLFQCNIFSRNLHSVKLLHGTPSLLLHHRNSQRIIWKLIRPLLFHMIPLTKVKCQLLMWASPQDLC